ncbi:hypothetical protein ACFO25_03360 [Paenactinomyces guangxiensis]|uniref:GPI inositol-deacylase PGAP1-like alpha/beta domain-containing protein n=1 Tax=Paenactinomyces guangxiensis TaxID=1490290 RepID=A0A7W1WRM6_9BACL|nr:hypothetical protein [Paenactinomyces guangxiensis]MBA4494802.1 hypothetical protein [Paenactinomyces guangxiensis]MBH8591885.1 hypothetical protein [Paenactinomyces guangxiensis]
MRHYWRLSLLIILCAVLIFPIGMVQAADDKQIPAPQPMGNVKINALPPPSNVTTPGTWFKGATPPNYDPNKPPIVFVQGMHGKAQDWWSNTVYHGVNDMYEKAYNAGYRTAFVQLHDAAGGDGATQWDNGRLLVQMLEQIYNHYGQKVNIVAHSKGGPDTQAALVHYNGHGFVNKVVTLGSPHHGSHLADLAYSWWAGWLAELLGRQDPATYSLQTGEMAHFREQTDNHANVNKNRYYTAAGTSWGPFPSALWSGGAYLAVHGSNDGLVNVWSTQLPYGQHLFTTDVDHDQIRTGTASFARIEPTLRTAAAAGTALKNTGAAAASAQPASDEQYIHGGSLSANQAVEREVAVDSTSPEAVFTILTKSPDVEVTLISPTGKSYSKTNKEYFAATDREFFAGASIQAFRINRPEAGIWKVSMTSQRDDAYLLTATFTGSDTFSVDLPAKSKQKSLPVKVKLHNPKYFDLSSIKVNIKTLAPGGKPVRSAGLQSELKKDSKQPGRFAGQLSAGTQAGTYNVTIEITGKTKQGQAFARTLVRSVYIGN